MDTLFEEIKAALNNIDPALAAEKTQEFLEKQNNAPLSIAITGESGSGKSTFVNALRGLDNKDDGAAPTGCVETTMKPTEYLHPEYPNIKIWDLPGVGTSTFSAEKYLEHVGFEKFDFFIIVCDTRFRENDAKLAQEIQKMKKKFYFVRSKIDDNIRDEKKSQREFNEENTLKRIRDNCIKELQKLGVESPKVFLVSNFELHLYDFKALWETLEKELPQIQRDALLLAFPNISLDVKRIILDHKGITAALQSNDPALAAKRALEHLEKQKNAPLSIAITGESGSGKSTFVNALRGLDNTDDGAAPTGCVETTTEPTEYLHPNYPNIKIWDLPGVGTTTYTAEKYVKRMGFEKFDFFIIVCDTRFRENDAKLAQEIQKIKKKFYFVRSKIDDNIRSEKRSQREFDEKNTLKQIRDNCIKELQKLGVEFPKVFLVSSFELHLYDFKALWETLEKELPQLQRDVLLLALPNISLDVINKKKKTLQARIKYYSVASAAGAAVPIPGVSGVIDLSIIVTFVIDCVTSLGLCPESLCKLSRVTGVPLKVLIAELKSPLTGVKVTTGLVFKVLASSAMYIAAVVAEEGSRFIPIIGIPLAMGLSFISTYKSLNFCLNTLAEDAQRIFTKALGLTTSV